MFAFFLALHATSAAEQQKFCIKPASTFFCSCESGSTDITLDADINNNLKTAITSSNASLLFCSTSDAIDLAMSTFKDKDIK